MGDFAYLDTTNVQKNAGVAYDSVNKIWSKSAATSAWDAGFVSTKFVDAIKDDQSIRCKLITSGLTNLREIGWCRGDQVENILNLATPVDFGFRILAGGSLRIYESGVEVNNPAKTVTVDDELRVQIVHDGTFKVKYWWREDSSSAEVLMYTSGIAESTLVNMFPMFAKALFNTQNGSFENVDMEITGTGSFTNYNPTFTDAQDVGNLDWDNETTHIYTPIYTDQNGAPEFVGAPPQLPSITRGQEFPNGIR